MWGLDVLWSSHLESFSYDNNGVDVDSDDPVAIIFDWNTIETAPPNI